MKHLFSESTARHLIIIPAEGDSPETAAFYAQEAHHHYPQFETIQIFDHTTIPYWPICGRNLELDEKIQILSQLYYDQPIEVHAQGGLGAAIACRLFRLGHFDLACSSCFFIGGAPCETMSLPAKFFHRIFATIWYWSPFPYFADDPNPTKNPTIQSIKQLSTAAMRHDPRRYRDQLYYISHWRPVVPEVIALPPYSWFVPNGEPPAPKWWHNTYQNDRAKAVWAELGIRSTPQPQHGFSFYSLIPATDLFIVMDAVRIL